MEAERHLSASWSAAIRNRPIAARPGGTACAGIMIDLPADQYRHDGAPTEWWWHTGTLRSGDRTFGFEINAASFAGQGGFAFTQVMLSDLQNERHYQQTTLYPPGGFDPSGWAQSDPTKDWFVRLGDPQSGSSFVSMQAPWWETLTNMHVRAALVDEETQATVRFDLTFEQQGPPFIVWGTGAQPITGPTPQHLQKNNYYYSLTRLQAGGAISVGAEGFVVSGVTWMDHEYGLFEHDGQAVKWTLQDLQLDNGACISNYFVPESGSVLKLNQPSSAQATVQTAGGTTSFVSTTLTPIGRTWTSPRSGRTYFLDFQIEIPEFDAVLNVETCMENQEFALGPVYEGVAIASGTFGGVPVSGTAWNEQAP